MRGHGPFRDGSARPADVSFSDRIVGSWSELVTVPLAAIAILVVVIVVVRLVGLRAFSKMSSFDFAITVSIGSILGATATSSTSIANGAVAVASLLGIQAAISWWRVRRASIERVVDNRPILLMDGSRFLDENLCATRVTRDDVFAKLRAANVARLADVRAVVLETTGDISVISGEQDVDPELLDGIRRPTATTSASGSAMAPRSGRGGP